MPEKDYLVVHKAADVSERDSRKKLGIIRAFANVGQESRRRGRLRAYASSFAR